MGKASKEYKYNEITFIDVALDCCGLFFLHFFYLFIVFFPLAILLYWWIKGINQYHIYFIIRSILYGLIGYYISRGIIKRKRFSILMGVLLSLICIYINIKRIDYGEIIKFTSTIERLMTWLITGTIMVISLFIGRLYKKP